MQGQPECHARLQSTGQNHNTFHMWRYMCGRSNGGCLVIRTLILGFLAVDGTWEVDRGWEAGSGNLATMIPAPFDLGKSADGLQSSAPSLWQISKSSVSKHASVLYFLPCFISSPLTPLRGNLGGCNNITGCIRTYVCSLLVFELYIHNRQSIQRHSPQTFSLNRQNSFSHQLPPLSYLPLLDNHIYFLVAHIRKKRHVRML